MKVLIVNDYLECGGAETVVRNSLQHLNEVSECAELFYGSKKYNFSVLGSFFNFYAGYKLSRKILSFKPDVVHVHNFSNNLSPLIWLFIFFLKSCMRLKFKVFFTLHDYFTISPAPGMYYLESGSVVNFVEPPTIWETLFKKLDSRGGIYSVYRKALWCFFRSLPFSRVVDKVVAPSEFIAKMFSLKYPNVSVCIVRNPVISCKSLNRESINLHRKNKVLTLGFFGRLSYEKGVVTFIEELESLQFPVRLRVFGAGPELAKLEGIVTKNIELNLEGKVPQESAVQAMAQCDAVVLPSIWYENSPMVVVESLSKGTKVIVRRLGGMEEMEKSLPCVFAFGDKSELDVILNSKIDSDYIVDVADFLEYTFEAHVESLSELYQK